MLSKPGGTARPFSNWTRALVYRVLFLIALILPCKCTEAPDTLLSMCVTAGRNGIFLRELPTFPWEPADLGFSLFPQAILLGAGRGLQPPVCLHSGICGCMLEVIFETSQDSTWRVPGQCALAWKNKDPAG